MRVYGWREPRAECFEALIAGADQHLPVTEVGLAVNRAHKIYDDALLVGTDAIDPVDEKNGRPAEPTDGPQEHK
jgi:hypothetical protein